MSPPNKFPETVLRSLADLARFVPPPPRKPQRPKYPAAVPTSRPSGVYTDRGSIFVKGCGLVPYGVFTSLNFSVEAPRLVEQLRQRGYGGGVNV